MLIVVGTNHKYSPIEIREKLSFSRKNIQAGLINLLSYGGIKAGVIISTCNRVELYASSPDIDTGIAALEKFICDYHHQELNRIQPYLYKYIGKEAILHLFEVACGLDSQIIGERQILEQVRGAYQQAIAVEATDRLLEIIFNNSIKVALKVRQETGIAEGELSIANAVSDLIKTKYGFIKDKKILIIGVGKVSELVTRYLKKEGITVVFIANRNYERARYLADYIGAQVLRFDRLKEKLKEVDIIISATSSPHLILRKEDILEAHRPLLIIDLAVPRDVEPQVKYIKDVILFCLDDLDFIIENNLKERKEAIPLALKIIKKEVENLCLKEHLNWELVGAHLL